MVVLVGSQAVGLGSHLSHLYFYKSKIAKYICTWSSAPYTVTEKLLYIIKDPMQVISGLLPETLLYEEFYIHYTKLSFTYTRKYTFYFVFIAQGNPSVIFLRLACGPPKLMCPGAPPRLNPISVGLLVRFRGVSPKVHWSEGPLVRRFVSPKVH